MRFDHQLASSAPSMPHLAQGDVCAVSHADSRAKPCQLPTIRGVIAQAAGLRIRMDPMEHAWPRQVNTATAAAQIQQVDHIRTWIHGIGKWMFNE